MPDSLLDPNFLKAQWDAFRTASWLMLPLVALVAFFVWWLRGRIDDGEVRGLRAERNAYKTKLELVDDKSADEAKQITALQQAINEIKAKIFAGEDAQALALTEEAEQRAVTLASTNNEIRVVVSDVRRYPKRSWPE